MSSVPGVCRSRSLLGAALWVRQARPPPRRRADGTGRFSSARAQHPVSPASLVRALCPCCTAAAPPSSACPPSPARAPTVCCPLRLPCTSDGTSESPRHGLTAGWNRCRPCPGPARIQLAELCVWHAGFRFGSQAQAWQACRSRDTRRAILPALALVCRACGASLSAPQRRCLHASPRLRRRWRRPALLRWRWHASATRHVGCLVNPHKHVSRPCASCGAPCDRGALSPLPHRCPQTAERYQVGGGKELNRITYISQVR